MIFVGFDAPAWKAQDPDVGLGYAFTSQGNQGYYFGYTAGDNDTPIAFNLGFTLGFLLW